MVRFWSEGLDGCGEGVPRTYVTGESAQSAFETLSGALKASFAGKDFASLEEVKAYLSSMSQSHFWQRNLAAFCAFELACLDLSSKCWHESLEAMFRVPWKQPPPYSGVIPLLPPDKLATFATLLKKNNVRHVKMKVGARVDPVVFKEALSILGTGVDLRVDANGAWTEEEALMNIELMEPYGVRAVEQPVAKENLKGLREVTTHSKVLIIADESVCSIEDARRLLDLGACDAFNIRLSKCGGFFGALAVLDIARTGGLSYQIGCQAGETGILSAAGRHLAGWIEGILYLEGSFGTWVLREDVVAEDIRFGKGGQASLLKGNGLGVHVNQEALERYAMRSETIPF